MNLAERKVMEDNNMALMAHLMRRVGFGATYEELESGAAKGYETTVEELLHPEEQPELPIDMLYRYNAEYMDIHNVNINQNCWTYRMVNTPRPLEEKICLLWHSIFCVGNAKCENARQILHQFNKFHRHGLGRFGGR